jgi:hypothetical protein
MLNGQKPWVKIIFENILIIFSIIALKKSAKLSKLNLEKDPSFKKIRKMILQTTEEAMSINIVGRI